MTEPTSYADVTCLCDYFPGAAEAYAAGVHAGQKAMLARAAAACATLYEKPNGCTCSGGRPGRHYDRYCDGWQDALDLAESTIQALEVEP